MGLTVVNTVMFDTVHVSLNGACNAPRFHSAAQERGINLRRVDLDNIYVSFDEANTARHVTDLLEVFADEVGYNT
jgi:glycine cleavage system pyridoxal-binding protein P